MRCHLETIITKLEKEKEESDFKVNKLKAYAIYFEFSFILLIFR